MTSKQAIERAINALRARNAILLDREEENERLFDEERKENAFPIRLKYLVRLATEAKEERERNEEAIKRLEALSALSDALS